MNICMPFKISLDFARSMDAGIVQDDNNLLIGGTLSQLCQKPQESITVRFHGFFPVELFCREIQASKECETFSFATRRNPVAATFF